MLAGARSSQILSRFGPPEDRQDLGLEEDVTPHQGASRVFRELAWRRRRAKVLSRAPSSEQTSFSGSPALGKLLFLFLLLAPQPARSYGAGPVVDETWEVGGKGGRARWPGGRDE